MSTLAAVLQARALAAGLAGGVSPSAPVSVVVDADVVDREALAARVLVGARTLAEGRRSSSSAASVVITGELLDFRVHVLTPATPHGTWSSRCPCTHAELVAHVRQRLALALEAPTAVEPVAPAPRVPPLPPPPREPPRERPQGLGLPGRVGVALLGVGGLGLGAGAAAVALTHRIYDETFQFNADLRTQGVVAVAVGSSMLVGGAALLVLDRRRRRARQETPR